MGFKENVDPDGVMPLADHLREARQRLLYALAGIFLFTIVGWFLYPYVFDFMAQPLADLRKMGRRAELNFDTVSAAFDLKLRISIFIGFLLSSPWWLYQIWAYVAPALHRSEKRYVLGFSFSGAILFALGAATGIWIMPHAVEVLTSFAPDSSVTLMHASIYFSFYMRLVLVFGVSFLVPLAMVALNFINVIRGEVFLKHWRWAVAIAFVFAAVANPLPDPWTMTFQALFLCGLYFLAVGIGILHDKRRDKRLAAEEAALDAALAVPPAGSVTDGESE
ncbi:twin-arginine translocase subunit TatC [Gleimia sp. 6138-11-ORH1]|uniref:twin-arginine translocase subunit TatC n=1 Tax=Gleimia sp. 6138-11-ORH1 TaxID=2973937 RepID=UPI002168DF72|nr:twin-arginine translocase subunit TatC [Gleimia sp. 6138-11-ORH1]MCS4484352.1 twin-arginine translocase subunit TatC [Gleimia sp. 6138-11-ORH1]